MASNMFLYWGSGSAPCWKPMIVLEEKGLSGYPNKKISFSDKEHKSDEIMKLNPRGQVPTFKDGDLVINESGAICFYLEEKYSGQGTRLFPSTPAERAQILQRVFEASNVEQVLIKEIVYYHFMTPADKLDQELLKKKYEAARTELERWNGYVEQAGGYVAGKDFSMADVFVFPYIAFGVRLGLDLSKLANLNTWYKNVESRKSVQASWPPHWKEEPGKGWMKDVLV